MNSVTMSTYQVPVEAVNWILAHLNRESKYHEKLGKPGFELSPNRISKFLATMDLSCLLRKELKSVVWQIDYLSEMYRSINKNYKLSIFRRPPSQAKKEIFMEALKKLFTPSKNKNKDLIWKILQNDDMMTNNHEKERNLTKLSSASQIGNLTSEKTIIPNVPLPNLPIHSLANMNESHSYHYPPTKTNIHIPQPSNIASVANDTYRASPPTLNCKKIPPSASPSNKLKNKIEDMGNRLHPFISDHKQTNTKIGPDVQMNGNLHQWVQRKPKITGSEQTISPSPSQFNSKTNQNTKSVHRKSRQNDASFQHDSRNRRKIEIIDLSNDSSISNKSKSKIKIKIEKGIASTGLPAHNEHDALIPRDNREWSLMHQLQSMGFTDKNEIFGGIRATQLAYGSSAITEHTDAAMMWIIQQREDADEARKVDEIRISSETLIEQTDAKKDNMLQSASTQDIFGTNSKKSLFFPNSILLESQVIQQIFRFLIEKSNPPQNAKQEILNYLKLEKNAHKWYGAVTPYCYFRHCVRVGIEKWNDQMPSVDECPLTFQESCAAKLKELRLKLEHAMFTLSEQVTGGLGNEPKLFVDARKDSKAKGLPDLPSHIQSNKAEIIELSDGEGNDEKNLPVDQSSITGESSTKRKTTDNSYQIHTKRSRSETQNELVL